MEKVSLTSTGVSETPSGLRAVAMFYRIADDGVMSRFSFKANVLEESIHVRWPSPSDIALVPADTGQAIVANNYGRYLDVHEVDQYNALIDAMDAAIDPTSTSPETPVVPADGIVPSPLVESQVESPGDGGNPVPPVVVTTELVVPVTPAPPDAVIPPAAPVPPATLETPPPTPGAVVPPPNWGAPPSAPEAAPKGNPKPSKGA